MVGTTKKIERIVFCMELTVNLERKKGKKQEGEINFLL